MPHGRMSFGHAEDPARLALRLVKTTHIILTPYDEPARTFLV